MDIQKLRTAIFEKHGIRIDPDDPIFSVVALNAEVLGEVLLSPEVLEIRDTANALGKISDDIQSRLEGVEKAIESATLGLVVLKDPETWVKGTKTALVAQFEKDPEFAKSFAAMAQRAFSDTSKEVLGKELIDLFKSATTDFENRVVNKVFENEGEYERTKRENLKLKDSLETEKERVAFLEKQLSSIGNLSSNSGTNYFNVIGSFIMGLVLAYLFFKGA